MNEYFKQPLSDRLTQQELADLIGVSQGQVGHWLRGKRVAAEKAVAIQKVTKGKIKRKTLRPDIF